MDIYIIYTLSSIAKQMNICDEEKQVFIDINFKL
jgi:hypothetical protein